MKFVVAPNAFKGSLSASQAAEAMAAGIQRVREDAQILRVPVADGGDGLAEVMIEALGGESRLVAVTGPLGDSVQARFCYAPGLSLAAIEMAEASGLALISEQQRDPMAATTYGTGELISAALDLGVSRLIVGIGGSATNDGGTGMAAALGVRFLGSEGQPLVPSGGSLAEIRSIDISGLDERIHSLAIEAVCDVDNPLLGEQGAAHVYGPQKGASPEQVEALDAGLANLADVVERDLGLDVRDLAGAGAAGGLGAGLKAFLGAELRRGVDLVLDVLDLEAKLQGARLVLTAEGQIDFQTVFGKAPAGVGIRARRQSVPCIAIAGGVGSGLGELHKVGIDAVFSLCSRPMTLNDAMHDAGELLAAATEQAVRCFLAGAGK